MSVATVLLDTHIWLWWVLGQDDLADRERDALDALATAGRPPAISAMSLWEAQMLAAKGRLPVDLPLARWLTDAAAPAVVSVQALDLGVVLALDSLPPGFHGDPADRIIVATARAAGLPLATRDGNIRKSRAVRLWRA